MGVRYTEMAEAAEEVRLANDALIAAIEAVKQARSALQQAQAEHSRVRERLSSAFERLNVAVLDGRPMAGWEIF